LTTMERPAFDAASAHWLLAAAHLPVRVQSISVKAFQAVQLLVASTHHQQLHLRCTGIHKPLKPAMPSHAGSICHSRMCHIQRTTHLAPCLQCCMQRLQPCC
jgi:hypothetical protein